MTNTFLLTWNPDNFKWENKGKYDAQVEAMAAGRPTANRWSTGVRTGGISRGDHALLLRQGLRERGLVGSGTFKGVAYRGAHWDGSGRTANYAPVDWEILLPVADRLDIEKLKTRVPGVEWNSIYASGQQVRSPSEGSLNALWRRHVASIPWRNTDELEADTFAEGHQTKVSVNRYERDRRARATCIAHHGCVCHVCDFDFARVYGPVGADYIHVHHIRDLSLVGEDYRVDAIKDLRPVCPNCHAMLHKKRPAMSIAQLQRKMRDRAKT